MDLLGLVPQLEDEGRRRARAGAAGPPLLLRGGGRRERDGARAVRGLWAKTQRAGSPPRQGRRSWFAYPPVMHKKGCMAWGPKKRKGVEGLGCWKWLTG